MSTPPSSISKFVSTTYYHCLAMCDSTDTANQLSLHTDPARWRRSGSGKLLQFTPRKLGDGKFTILCNGSQDADIKVEELKLKSAVWANATPNDMGASLVHEGSMKVVEPQGVLFLDLIVSLCREMLIDYSQVVFVVKTFFVGQTADGQLEVITSVAPIHMTWIDVQAEFGIQGGRYDITWLAIANGTNRLPQYSNLANGISLKTDTTLKATIQSYQQQIQSNYQQYFNCVVKQLKASSVSDKLVTPVSYKIILDDVYVSGNYKPDDIVPAYKDTDNCEDTATLTFGSGTSIEDGITKIMNRCTRVKQDAVEPDKDGKLYTFKILCTVNTTRGGKNTEVIYKVIQTELPVSARAGIDELNINPRNTIIYKYLHTGENTDVLDFDLKMNLGLSYLQIASNSNTTPSGPTINGTVNVLPNNQAAKLNKHQGGETISQPLFFGSTIESPNTNNTNSTALSSQYAYNIAKQASLESRAMKLKVIGNPDLLNSINNITTSNAVNGTTNSTGDVFSGWGVQPCFVRVDVFMPNGNDFVKAASGVNQLSTLLYGDNPNYARNFWYEGYYMVIGIESEFINGVFTQTIEALSAYTNDPLGALDNGQTQPKNVPTFQTNVNACYDAVVGVVPSAPTDATAITNTGPMTSPGTLVPIDQLPKWVNAPANVKDAITKAATKWDVPLDIMVRIAIVESTLNPKAKNIPQSGKTGSKASGLYQFIPSTFAGLGYNWAQVFDPYVNADAGGKFLKQNISILRQNGAPVDLGSLYLMHFNGAGGGAAVMKFAVNSPNTTVRSAYYTTPRLASAYDDAKASNAIITDSTTCGQLYQWATNLMVKKVAEKAGGVSTAIKDATQYVAAQAAKAGEAIGNVAASVGEAVTNAGKTAGEAIGMNVPSNTAQGKVGCNEEAK